MCLHERQHLAWIKNSYCCYKEKNRQVLCTSQMRRLDTMKSDVERRSGDSAKMIGI
jgi:hypothetical protein